jgi:hypothetical protein
MASPLGGVTGATALHEADTGKNCPTPTTSCLVLIKSSATGTLSTNFTLPSPTFVATDTNAVCPPTQAQINAGLVGCAIAVAQISPQVVYGDALLQYPGQLTPQAPTLALSPGNASAGQTVNVRDTSGATSWWWGDALTANSIPSSDIAVGSVHSGVSTVSVSAATYNGSTLQPPALGGGFVVPCGLSGNQTVTLTQPNSTPAPGAITASATLDVVAGGGPAVTSVAPTRGPSGGGTAVTIGGCNFTGATAVTFGGTPAKSFTVAAGGDTITAVSPPGKGTVNVAVVGPGGTSPTSAATQFTYGLQGYDLVGGDGGIFSYGDAAFHGSLPGLGLNPNKPIVGMAATPDGGGYWLVASDGGVFAFGDANYWGSMGGKPLDKPIVGMAATTDGGGYWLVASDGGVFAFGDAAYNGSMGGQPLAKPIVGMAATPDGGGYWLVASDGGVFAFGDAAYDGSANVLHLSQPIVGMAAADSGGYWLVAADGGVFAYGDAVYSGSLPSLGIASSPVVGIVSSDPGGYWEVASNGGVFSFGDAPFFGAVNPQTTNLAAPITSAGLA